MLNQIQFNKNFRFGKQSPRLQSQLKQLATHFLALPKSSHEGHMKKRFSVPDEHPISCNFESDVCPLHQVANDDDQWYRVLASQISLEKGTAKDHSSGQGLYKMSTWALNIFKCHNTALLADIFVHRKKSHQL